MESDDFFDDCIIDDFFIFSDIKAKTETAGDCRFMSEATYDMPIFARESDHDSDLGSGV